MTKTFLALAAGSISLLTACAPNVATVSDFNGDSVKIQTNQLAANGEEAKANAQIEADRICSKGHKKRAEYASTRTLPNDYIDEHLFLCLEA